MRTTVAIAGKFDPLHEGHIDHIVKASKLGDYLYVITHTDEVVATKSAKGFCAVPLKARVAILEAIMRAYAIKGQVNISDVADGTCADKLRLLSPNIFAKGGDRTSNNMPQNEIDVCNEIGCQIVYGVGDLLNSSSKIMGESPINKPRWKLRESNEQYDIYDSRIAEMVVSVTYLKPHQSTSGHKHPHPELYICCEGNGWLQIGEIGEHASGPREIAARTRHEIPAGIFHQVHNESDETLVFLCICRGEDKT